jgi:hypothetical protein
MMCTKLSFKFVVNLFCLCVSLFPLRDDGVAAEATIDFDAPFIGKSEGVKMWLGGFLFFATMFGLVALTGPTSQRQAVGFLSFC